MDLQKDVAAIEPQEEWTTPELAKMDVSAGTLNSANFGSDGNGPSSAS